jgi:hypothetical protein
VSITESAYSLVKTVSPSKRIPFQMIIEPPEAPIEGRNANLLKAAGEIFLTNNESKFSFFVS